MKMNKKWKRFKKNMNKLLLSSEGKLNKNNKYTKIESQKQNKPQKKTDTKKGRRIIILILFISAPSTAMARLHGHEGFNQ